MAYLNLLASVPQGDVQALQGDPTTILTPTLKIYVSHLIAYWVEAQPLGALLGRAVDGGKVIHSSLRHQLRNPCFHEPETVRTLTEVLSRAWEQAIAVQPLPADDWYRIEIEKVLRLFSHAASRSECVVSAIEPYYGIHFATKK